MNHQKHRVITMSFSPLNFYKRSPHLQLLYHMGMTRVLTPLPKHHNLSSYLLPPFNLYFLSPTHIYQDHHIFLSLELSIASAHQDSSNSSPSMTAAESTWLRCWSQSKHIITAPGGLLWYLAFYYAVLIVIIIIIIPVPVAGWHKQKKFIFSLLWRLEGWD